MRLILQMSPTGIQPLQLQVSPNRQMERQDTLGKQVNHTIFLEPILAGYTASLKATPTYTQQHTHPTCALRERERIGPECQSDNNILCKKGGRSFTINSKYATGTRKSFFISTPLSKQQFAFKYTRYTPPLSYIFAFHVLSE